MLNRKHIHFRPNLRHKQNKIGLAEAKLILPARPMGAGQE